MEAVLTSNGRTGHCPIKYLSPSSKGKTFCSKHLNCSALATKEPCHWQRLNCGNVVMFLYITLLWNNMSIAYYFAVGFVVSRKSKHMRKNSKVILNPFICVINNNHYNYMGKQEENTTSVELSRGYQHDILMSTKPPSSFQSNMNLQIIHSKPNYSLQN
jgi:hypothetical protein